MEILDVVREFIGPFALVVIGITSAVIALRALVRIGWSPVEDLHAPPRPRPPLRLVDRPRVRRPMEPADLVPTPVRQWKPPDDAA